MRMTSDPLKEIRNTTIDFCWQLDGHDRTQLIDGVLDDLDTTEHLDSPIKIRRHYRDLLTTLVKTFGH
tara:strand:- start:280 stop:483 length:204 start_codon:yes stop_codon:yes gene_type:complete